MDLSARYVQTYEEYTRELAFTGEPNITYDCEIPWNLDMIIEFEIIEENLAQTHHPIQIHVHKNYAYVELGSLELMAERI